MSDKTTAKLLKHGRSQAVRLAERVSPAGQGGPRAPVGRGVLLDPLEFDVKSWLAELARYRDIPFMEEGREQPPVPA
jgi:antitoxin VapB